MAARAGRRLGGSGQSWMSALLGVGVLVTGGFLLGLVVGVVSEEPELVIGHLTGRSTKIAWDRPPGSAPESVASAPATKRVEAVKETIPIAAPAPSRAPSLPSVAAPPPGYEPGSSPGRYSIQVGAFIAEAGAGSVARDLRGKGYRVEVLPPTTDSRWRVRVGPVDGESAAERMAARLKTEEKLPTWVMQLRPR